ncbi:MAG: hypothetical protein R6X34_05765 [Chloroflexota bacterium]
MKYRVLAFTLVFFVMIAFLAACGVTEPSPTLPPPPTPLTDGPPPPIVVEGVTVAADEGVRETAVAESSPTPVETPTLAPTATPTELPEPVINPAQMPAINNDLLFVGNGKLKRWQRDGQVVTLLDGDVVDYSLSADGKRAIVAQLVASTEISNTVTAVTQTVKTYAMNYVNLETGDTQLLIPAIYSFIEPSFQLSQDGRHLAISGLGLGDPESLTLGEKVLNELYVMEIGTGQPPKKVHECGFYCEGIVWHQDNNLFVFGSDDGLFLYNLAGKEPELLLRGEPEFAYNQRYRPLSWAKNGRWLMVLNQGYIEGVVDTAIFDVPTKQLMPIPYAFLLSGTGTHQRELTWMTDDRVFLTLLKARPSVRVLGETYRVNQDAGEMQLDETVVLIEALMQPLAPMHWENGRFGYGLFERNHPENGLYQRTAFNEPPERVSDMPTEMPDEIVWAPDNSGAVMQVAGGVYYAPVGGELVDLKTAVGLTGHNFTWLP